MACERRKMTRPHPLFDHENFHFEEPRQLIISYAIHPNYKVQSNKGKVCPKEVSNCRLVNSDWLKITTQALRQARKPLFYLKLDQEHTFKGTGYFGKNGNKKLVLNKVSPLALEIEDTYFRSASSIRTIGQLLSRFRDNLVSLKVAINPKNSGLLFPENLKLSLLQHFSVEFTEDTSKPASLSLQTILDSCPEIKHLGFPSGPGILDNVVLPEDFSRVNLSKTLTEIEFSSKLENQHLEIMTRSSLPKLKKFTLPIHRTPFEDGLIYRVLDNVKSSLEYLYFQGVGHGRTDPPTYFRFPVMEKLKQLELETQHLELEPETQSLETFLPNLTDMRFMSQTQSMLSKWTRSNSELTSVTTLNIIAMRDDNLDDHLDDHLDDDLDENFLHVESGYYVNLGENDTREIAHTFPNVTDFTIDFHHEDFSALKAVWQEMKQVTQLTLFVPKPKGNIICQDQWTSVLLGIPLKMAASLRTKSSKTIKLGSNSVKEMKNLNTLCFMELETFDQTKNSKMVPLLSDVVFELAFFEMPQLRSILLGERCWASQKVTQAWKSRGRKLFYS